MLTAGQKFRRHLNLDEVEQAIKRLERAIKIPYPATLRLFAESGALKQAAHSAELVTAHTPMQTSTGVLPRSCRTSAPLIQPGRVTVAEQVARGSVLSTRQESAPTFLMREGSLDQTSHDCAGVLESHGIEGHGQKRLSRSAGSWPCARIFQRMGGAGTGCRGRCRFPSNLSFLNFQLALLILPSCHQPLVRPVSG